MKGKFLFSLVAMALVLAVQGWWAPTVGAQSMTMSLEGEVKLQPDDMDATAYFPVKDQNDNLCALIKVSVTNKLKNPLVLETGGLAVQQRMERENGEIWFWVPAQVRNLHFSCSEYKAMSPIPVRLQEGKVYRLTLRTDAQVETVMNAALNFGYLKVQVLPEDAVGAFVSVGRTADYELGGDYVQDGVYTQGLDYGTYYYKVESEFYETATGRVQLSGPDDLFTVRLKPTYGYLKITSEPSGARVAIDGKLVGNTPLELDEKYAAGSHRIRLQAENYALMEEMVMVEANAQVQSHHYRLVPQFGTVTCRSEMADAEIWVDNEYKGVGSWTGKVSSRTPHILEARKAGHKSQSVSFTLQDGETRTITVGAPVPMYGTLVLESTPSLCEIWIDGKKAGTSPKASQLLVGEHKIVLKKDGYEDLSFDVMIAHNQQLVQQKELKKRTVVAPSSGQSASSKGKTNFTADYGIEMVFVEGGTFQMGATSEQGSDAYDDEKPVHSVTLSDFYIGKYEVTQAQWKAVMGKNPSRFQGDNLPVENVSWNDIQEFIKKLNRLTGKRYRLPTEAEWEYAARGGKKSKGYKYAGSNSIGEVAWYDSNSGYETHPVGQKQPNELGLYDMSGNVWEWCQDWYGNYNSSSQTNPSGPASGSYRVLRGGSWYRSARYCRVSDRSFNYPSNWYYFYGFRLVLLP
ncbi:MAG: SUMF1/EgtB/PvdO family nonheme iron enzyme [Bacteroidales bacterium]|nr:SUMF1/EgtB/PvdO family nonheme iron enzyme [Bacteroidales bacterium]